MGEQVAQFIAYLVNNEDRSYLYARVEGKYFRIASPTKEHSYVVRFHNRGEMYSDIDALKRVNDDMVCFFNKEATPYKDQKFHNLITMLRSQGDFSLLEMVA